MDATYRSEFRELFAVHFAAFDAKLVRWLFLFWVTNVGLMIALLKL